MNILYTFPFNNLDASMASDFQYDMLFDGLKKSNHFVYDFTKMKHMYDTFPSTEKEKMWGKGWFYGLLKDDHKEIVIDDVDWDIVCFPIHHTYHNNKKLIFQNINGLINKFGIEKIAVIDGHDQQSHHIEFEELTKKGLKYFKRENIGFGKSIHFGIQKEKIISATPYKDKTIDIAPLIPVNQSIDPSYMKTYIYDNEKDYYDMYAKSKFALTSCKGGWDTLRHYEIVAAGCIPYFVDIEDCPKDTLNFRFKLYMKMVKSVFNINWNFTKETPYGSWPHCGIVDINNPGKINCDPESYDDCLFYLRMSLLEHCTTEAVAENFIRKFYE